jgi:pimeloyl-ACP methyl ester carboxylesterase
MQQKAGYRPERGQEMFTAYTLPVLKRVVISDDGAYIDTFRLGNESPTAIVICHGFGGNKNIGGLVALAQELAADYTVYTFDFRGHGLSPGASTFGYLEALDLKAVFDLAREDGHHPIAALGFSMGGVALLRYAAQHAGLASVITVSVPADLRTSTAPGARLIRKQMGNPMSRVLAERRYKVKIDRKWKRASPPAEIVHKVAPLTLIHGEDDYIFEPEQARELHRLAPGSRLRIFPGFGHAEQGYGPEFLSFVRDVLKEDLGRAEGKNGGDLPFDHVD